MDIPEQERVDEASAESFPASDAPSWTATHAGAPPRVAPAERGVGDMAARLRAHVEKLAGELGERNDQTPEAHARLQQAAEYIANTMLDAGRAITRYPFGGPREVENIELEIPGARPNEAMVIVGAHYDSPVRAPGADDNASGVAVLLELARALSAQRLGRCVRLVAFANAEPPHRGRASMGSREYAARLAHEGQQVSAMVALEGLGFFGPPPRDYIALVGDPRSRPLVAAVAHALRGAFDLRVRALALPRFFPLVGASDHASFWRERIPAIMVTDTGRLRYPHFHARTDTPDRLDYARMARLVPGLTAAIARLAGDA